MKSVQSVLKIHSIDKWSWIYIPALILFSSFLVNLTVSYFVNSVKIYTGGVSSIFIYIFVAGIITVSQTFPFALGMSVRRKDFFIGTSLMGVLASIGIGVLIYVFALIENNTSGWGTGLHFFHFPYVNDGNALQQIIIYIILLAFLFFSGFTISSFVRRFGGKGMLILSISTLLLGGVILLLFTHYQVWYDIFQWFTIHTAVQLALWLLPFIVFFLVASFLLIRRATV
ncbi:hypothetical protein [Bacillus sp. FSL K6-3431]|uniref:hypothetical protein n=1 Tax=Bacillus sp. FSL K6-3431 TaxID=2921500 RepID=UPI0030FCE6A3